jgi:hypothetical protein
MDIDEMKMVEGEERDRT